LHRAWGKETSKAERETLGEQKYKITTVRVREKKPCRETNTAGQYGKTPAPSILFSVTHKKKQKEIKIQSTKAVDGEKGCWVPFKKETSRRKERRGQIRHARGEEGNVISTMPKGEKEGLDGLDLT